MSKQHSLRAGVIALFVAVLGGVLVAIIAGEGRFAQNQELSPPVDAVRSNRQGVAPPPATSQPDHAEIQTTDPGDLQVQPPREPERETSVEGHDWETVVDGFVFEFTICSRARTSVTCELLITNDREDRSLAIYTSKRRDLAARLISAIGEEFLAYEVSIGSVTASITQIGPGNVGAQARATLVQGVAMRTRLKFDDIPESVSTFQLLQVSGYWDGRAFHAQLRNGSIG